MDQDGHINRNIVLLGNTGAGKSTLVNHIIGREELKVHSSIAGVTRSALVMPPVTAQARGYKFTFKLIDTAGVYDRSNQEIISDIKRCFKQEIQSINLILFVFKDGRFTSEDKKTFEMIIKSINERMSDISALVVTNCDQKGHVARKRIVDDIHATAEKIADFVKKGIYTVGFPNLSEIDEDLRSMYEQSIKKDECEIRDLVSQCKKEVSTDGGMSEHFWTSLCAKCPLL